MIHVTNDSHHRRITRKAVVTNISKQLQDETLQRIFIKDSYQRVDQDSYSYFQKLRVLLSVQEI
jgi:hypothetical protein